MMRYLWAALMLIVVVAGAAIVTPREFRHPARRGGHPPAPTAAEESGVAEPEGMQVSPAPPMLHRQVKPPDQPVTRRRPGRVVLPTPSESAQGGGPGPMQSPLDRMRDDVAWPLSSQRRIRDPEVGAGQPSPNEHPAANEPAIQPSLQQADIAVRAPVVTPPVLLTPVAGYPAEGYRIALDRAMLTPRLRVEAVQGRVMLKVLVRADGSVGSVEVTESSGILVLDQAAVRQAGAWVFAPATRDGQPVEAWALISVRFVVP